MRFVKLMLEIQGSRQQRELARRLSTTPKGAPAYHPFALRHLYLCSIPQNHRQRDLVRHRPIAVQIDTIEVQVLALSLRVLAAATKIISRDLTWHSPSTSGRHTLVP